MCAFQINSQAQNRSDKTSKVQYEQRMSLIKNSKLDVQLTKLFGESYDLSNKKVKRQLNKNIDNKKASYEIRRMSLVALYGSKKAAEHASRIGK